MSSIRPQIEKAKAAAPLLQTLEQSEKTDILSKMANKIIEHQAVILRLNRQDLETGKAMHLSPLMIDRLMLNEERLHHVTNFLKRFAEDKDIEARFKHLFYNICDFPVKPEVGGIIYESCPYISILAALFSLKAEIVVILRGGKEAFHTNTAIVSILNDVLEENELPREILTLLPTTDRVTMTEMIQLKDLIDFVIPQGSEGLINYVNNNSKISVIRDYTGFISLCLDYEISDRKAMEYLLPIITKPCS